MVKKTDKITVQWCSICKQQYMGHGHNAQPVNTGRCCTECNDTVVIPARLYQLRSL